MTSRQGDVIAIIDDDEAANRALAFLLEALGRPSQSFPSASAFLAARSGNISALILDADMPGIHGLELLRRLRAEGDDIPVMLISGALTPDLAAKAKALGARCVAEKPFEMDDLSQFLDSLAG